MFNHSIKVPRLYKTAAKIAREVSEGKGSIKRLVYEDKKHPNKKALYALLVQAFQKSDDIDKLLNQSKLLVKEPRFDRWLARILILELLWGKKRLPGESVPVKTILAYEQQFKALLSDANCSREIEQVDKPRYVRINTLKISINEAIEGFRSEGWVLKRYSESDNYLGFIDAVASLSPEEFIVDLHIPYLLIFPPKTTFYQHNAYKNGSIMLQDKASCLPVHILNPTPGSCILDMCAAPGMKTTQCAALIQDSGKIFATEIIKKRYEVLNKIVESSGATCIKTINEDVLKLEGDEYTQAEYILVDPSCSGSGITDRVETGQQKRDQDEDRLSKLAGFQIKLLRHALLRFPKAKRVVYSTCSVYPEENEDVVRQVLETCTTYKLVPALRFVKDLWHNFGSREFGDIGKYCLYAKPDIDMTNGFFIAVFERLEEGEENQFINWSVYEQKMQMIKAIKEQKVEDSTLEADLSNRQIKTEIKTESESDEGQKKPRKKKSKTKRSVLSE